MQQQLPEGWIEQPPKALYQYVLVPTDKLMYVAGIYKRQNGWMLRAPGNVRLGPFDTANAAMLAYKVSKSANAI